MKQLEHNIHKQGAQVAYNSEVTDITTLPDGYKLTIQDEKGKFAFTTQYLINAAGLQSDNIARMSQTFEPEYSLSYWKGEYFAMGNGKNAKINHLIYPVPDPNSGGVGIHVTLDLNHRAKLGPNAIYIPDGKQDFQVNPTHQSDFFESARTFLPFLEMNDIYPDQAGIRPKLSKPGQPFRDFIIRNEKGKGHPNLINLIGIESPGLTSCLAIAEYVSEVMGESPGF